MPSSYGIEWDEEAFMDMVYSVAADKLDAIGRHVTRAAQRNVSQTPGVSKPGEFPYLQSGDLRASIGYEVDCKSGQALVSVDIGTDILYGIMLEEGTAGGEVIYAKDYVGKDGKQLKAFSWIDKDGKRVYAAKMTLTGMRARPWLRPTLTEESPPLRGIIGS